LAQWEQSGKGRNKEKKEERKERKGLTLTGLLMEGLSQPEDRITHAT
jgi:hypothetical protein